MRELFGSLINALLITLIVIKGTPTTLFKSYYITLRSLLQKWKRAQTDEKKQALSLSYGSKLLKLSLKLFLLLTLISVLVVVPIYMSWVIDVTMYLAHLTWMVTLALLLISKKKYE